MKYPKESLDDFVVPALEPTDPPRAVRLRLTGEVEVLKPLARWEGAAKIAPVAAEGAGRRSWFDSSLADRAPASLSWFHRSLALGGTVAMVALVLTSAIVIGMYDRPGDRELVQSPSDGSDSAQDERPERRQRPLKVPPMSDKFTAPDSVPTVADRSDVFEFGNTRSAVRVRTVRHSASLRRPHYQAAAYRPRRRSPHPQLLASHFFPTTLVIYVENGLVKRRVERWL